MDIYSRFNSYVPASEEIVASICQKDLVGTYKILYVATHKRLCVLVHPAMFRWEFSWISWFDIHSMSVEERPLSAIVTIRRKPQPDESEGKAIIIERVKKTEAREFVSKVVPLLDHYLDLGHPGFKECPLCKQPSRVTARVCIHCKSAFK